MKNSLLPDLLDILALKKLDECIYDAANLDIGSFSVYGGQVLAQAITAAYQTVDPSRCIHSLHSYFLRRGDNSKNIQYKVAIIRDGRSFSTRRVTAFQEDKMIFILAASFHIQEDSPLEHQKPALNVADAESLSSFADNFAQFAERFDIKPKGLYAKESPLVFHPLEKFDPFNPGKRPPLSHVWFKANGALPDDRRIHEAVTAYASDFSLLITALFPHDVSLFTTPMHLASIDHAMWFHRPIKADDWLLYAVNSPTMANSTGFCTGSIYDREGNLVASVAQEGLLRIIKK